MKEKEIIWLDSMIIEELFRTIHFKTDVMRPIREFDSKNNKSKHELVITTVNRLSDVVSYLQSDRMDISYFQDERSKVGTFQDWISNATQLQGYVKLLFKTFGFENSYIDGNYIFHYKGAKESVSDSHFMEYLRSIAVMHPNNTNRSIKRGFQKRKEFSPHVRQFTYPDKDLLEETFLSRNSPFDSYVNLDYDPMESFIVTIYEDIHGYNVKWLVINPDEIRKFVFHHYMQLITLIQILNGDKEP